FDYNDPSQHNFLAISGTLNFTLGTLVTLSGTFGFAKVGTEIWIVAEHVNATIELGSFGVGISEGKLALLLKANGTKAVEASRGLGLHGAGFENVGADEITIRYNDTGTNFQANPYTLTVNDVTQDLRVPSGTIAAPYLSLFVKRLHANLAGLVAIEGDFSFEKGTSQSGTPIAKAAVNNLETSPGDGNTNYVETTQGRGGILITSAGIAASLEAHVELVNVTGITLNGTLKIEINNTAAPVLQTFNIGNDSFELDLEAGPFLRVVGAPVTLGFTIDTTTVALVGNIGFQQSKKANGDKIVIIQATDVNITGYSGPGSGTSPVDIHDASGTLVLTNGGMAGSISFTAEAGFGDFEGGATLRLEINKTNQT